MKRLALLIALAFLGGSIGYAAVVGVAGSCVLGPGQTNPLTGPGCTTPDNNPNAGLSDWKTDLFNNLGITPAQVNSSVNFSGVTYGTMPSNYYSALGITITTTGIFSTYGVEDINGGPGEAGNSSPTSTGEGVNTTANGNYLGPNVPYSSGSAQGTVTFSFATPVRAFGLYVIDLFNPMGTNPDTLTAYTGQNGSGNVIATLTAAGDNFQSNYLYFMGLISTSSSIGSVVFTNSPATSSFPNGFDNYVAISQIQFAGAVVPEPSSLALVFGGLTLLALRFRKKPAR